MLNDEELGAALSQALHELVEDIEPDPMLLERVDRDARPPQAHVWSAQGRRFRRRVLVAIPVVVAALIAAAIFALGGLEQPAPSYAVTLDPDGSIQVTIYDIVGVAGANARLRALGAPVVVVPMSASCPTHVSLSGFVTAEHPAGSIRIARNPPLPANTTVVLAAERIAPNKVEQAMGRITGPVPSCVSSKGVTGPGLPGWTPPNPIPSSQTTTAAG